MFFVIGGPKALGACFGIDSSARSNAIVGKEYVAIGGDDGLGAWSRAPI